MQLASGTSTGPASFGSALASSAFIHRSEGTPFMARQHDTRVLAQLCAHQRGGGGSPCLTKLRPFAIAGAVVLGAGFVVFPPAGVGELSGSVTARDVTLTAGDSDLLAPWIDQFNIASANATELLDTFIKAPGVGMQQWIADMSGYLQDFFNNPTMSTIASITGQLQDNMLAVSTGYTLQNATGNTADTVAQHTLELWQGLVNHQFVLFSFADFLPPSIDAAQVQPIVDFLASPLSGIIMGELGPEISPWVALMNSINAGDGLNETLANMVGAYFNGATLSLNSLIPVIDQANFFPAGMNMENLAIAFGGLLTPGSVGGLYNQPPGVGGSILNSLGIELTGVPHIHTIDLTANPVGPLAAFEGWGQAIAALLGWNGSGSPLNGIDLPTIPADTVDSTLPAAAAADMSGLIHDLASLF